MASNSQRAAAALTSRLAYNSAARSSQSSPTLAALNARSNQAKRQAARRRQRAEVRERTREKWDIINEQRTQNTTMKTLVRAERKRRREDWDLGPLAPHRDIAPEGMPLETSYGALPADQSRGVRVPKAQRKKDWEIGIVEGDRVVIIKPGHRDKGKIGKVQSVLKESGQVTLERLNLANVALPEWQLRAETDKTSFRVMPLPLSLENVRLVVPLIDPDTGVPEDTIIEELTFAKERWRRGVKLPKRRFVQTPTGALEIPYPESEPERLEYDQDTLRIEVEERSWTPTLSVPPMPSSVIDELRNKYSRYRDRHDDAWVAAKDAEHDAKSEKMMRMKARMITPLEELQQRKQADKLAQGEPELDEEALASIGEVMARNLKLAEGGLASHSPRTELRI